ncbi:MAG TPA: ABC transporter substrate-binding protein [Acetobacteraceae bacterium]|jgi:dipeptide transport system substrate-binding protein|nr:ABC transporter substrate-binding protein [Acetobacteraceae bacterium]
MRITRQLALWPLVTLLISWTAQADTLAVCTEASPDALNAQLSTANTTFDVSEQIADRLVEMKIGGSDLVPGLAESWTISEDGLTYTFKLRQGVNFQSNADFKPTRPFNADDVVFSFRRMYDKSDPFYQSVNGNFPEFVDLIAPNLSSVEKIDTTTVAFRLKTPLAPLLPSLSMQPFSIVSAEYAASLQKSGKLAQLDQEPIGTGPFSFVQYQKDALIRFRAFREFWGNNGAQPDRVAKVDNLVFVITPDASVRYAKLRTNECQIARYPNPADLPTLRTNPDIKVQEADVVGTNYLRFRVDRKPLDDRRVRLALAQAIDMNGLVSAVFQGAGTPAASLVPPSLWGHDASLKPYAHDPAAAKELLAEAGYPNGFTIDLWAIPVVRAYMPNGRRAAEMIQSDWAALGVTANITTFEWGEYLKRSRAGEPSVGMLGGTWDYPDPSELLLGFTCNNPGNAGHWCNQVYTDAVQKANVVTNQDERAKLYIAADKAVYDDVFLIRLADVKAYVPVRKNVEGFKLHFLGGQPFGGVSLGK